MKVILMAYHKNINLVYEKQWIETFKQSILNQHYKDFTIMEVNYGGTEERIFEDSIFESKSLPTFIHAMNYLIDKALTDGADAICNSNVDDNFNYDWLQTEIPFIENGFDIVSCNFSLIKDGIQLLEHHFDELNIKEELSKNHNVISHPAVIYSKRFLEGNRYIPEQFPTEDLQLWQRTIDNYKFKIVQENLLYHRIHQNSVCKSSNR